VEWLEIIYFVSALCVMLFGLVGCVLPVIPGIPIIWLSAFAFGFLTDFEFIGRDYLLIFGILSAVSLLLDWIAGVYGAKKLGASRWGMLGAFVGMIVGVIVGTIPGLIIGPLIGAVVFELLAGKKSGMALKAGFGTFLGFLAGVVMKFGLGIVMIAVFVYIVVRSSG
jgi:uncharacterized protein YqgC (DUF456 family)